MQPYLVIDDILSNPEFYVEWAQVLEYDYTDECGELALAKHKTTKSVGWRGYRSKELSFVDANIAVNVSRQVYKRAINTRLSGQYIQRNYLHYSTQEISYDDTWWHQDSSTLAGVIYLNPNPEPESGTLIKVGQEIVTIENVFNRLVLYDASLTHRPQRCFGNTINTARLTMTIFVNQRTT